MVKKQETNKEDIKRDLNEIKIVIEIMKRQIEELSKKLQIEPKKLYTVEDLKELADMKNNRG